LGLQEILLTPWRLKGLSFHLETQSPGISTSNSFYSGRDGGLGLQRGPLSKWVVIGGSSWRWILDTALLPPLTPIVRILLLRPFDSDPSRPSGFHVTLAMPHEETAIEHPEKIPLKEVEHLQTETSLPSPVVASPPAPRKTRLSAAAIIPLWIFLSAAVIIYNNYLFNTLNFKYPVFLVTWHLTFAVSLPVIGGLAKWD
jgi:hypothetical protein